MCIFNQQNNSLFPFLFLSLSNHAIHTHTYNYINYIHTGSRVDVAMALCYCSLQNPVTFIAWVTISSFTVIAFTGSGGGGGDDGNSNNNNNNSGANVEGGDRGVVRCDLTVMMVMVCCGTACVLLVVQVQRWCFSCCHYFIHTHSMCILHITMQHWYLYLFASNPSVMPLKLTWNSLANLPICESERRNLLNSFNLVQIINYTKFCSLACTRLRYAKFAPH